MKTTPLLLLLAAALAPAASCTNTVSLTGASGTGAGSGSQTAGAGGACAGGLPFQRLTLGPVTKVDLVLMVDNSRSMADKQQVLALAIPDLVTGLVNPACVDANGAAVPPSQQPAGPLDACPPSTQRLFQPLLDMHIGLLSSSLGSFGADGCPDTTNDVCANMATSTSNNDHGHLVTRTDPCAPGHVTTYENEGFLAWDPAQMLMPPGQGQVGSLTSPGLVESLHDLVVGDGQDGCGFESQNEAWYRFLVDTSPYQSITLTGQNAQPAGIDNVLLKERADFLRKDSLLVIVVVTDETDTSLKEFGFYPLFAQELENGQPFHLPTARSECRTKGPGDPCCASCGENTPVGCPADPGCMTDSTYTDATENLAIRAFGLSGGQTSHKARYGIEFFYQPSRYIQALSNQSLQDAVGNFVPNPIFAADPADPHGPVRDPSMVLYAAITGVPWQLIARQKNGMPDLVGGVSALDSTQVGGFKTFAELSQTDVQGNTFWDDIAGDPESYVPPISPFMQESTVPRAGIDPITGTAVSPPGSPTGANPINGHEWNVPQPPGDIEYACIFPILTPIDCSQPGTICDCDGDPTKDNPLCDPNPNDSMKPTLQSRAKAYPGVKQLAIAKGMQGQGIVASICPKQLSDPTQPDYGYRPAVKAIVDQMQSRLAGPCLANQLPINADGEAQCVLLEATNAPSCDCNTPGRSPVAPEQQCLVQAAKQDPLAATAAWTCFCQLAQTTGAALTECQNELTPASTTDGWCYVDASATSPLGSPALVARCPATERRLIRFVGKGQPTPGATVFVSCQ